MRTRITDWARIQWGLEKKQPDGSTLRQHYASVWRQTRQEPKELAVINPLPRWAVPLLMVFSELDSMRGGTGFGMNPISLAMIQQWERVHRIRLTAWERNTIHALDLVRMEIANG